MKTLLICCALLTALLPATAQKKSNKVNEVTNTVDSTLSLIRYALKKKKEVQEITDQLGGEKKEKAKKKKAGDAEPEQAEPESIDNKPVSAAGSISPSAIYIDADYFGDFVMNAAVIQKKNSTALISASGEFFIPYNKMEFSNQYPYGFFSAYDRTAGKTFMLNAQGKKIWDITNKPLGQPYDDRHKLNQYARFVSYMDNDMKSLHILDYSGKLYTISDDENVKSPDPHINKGVLLPVRSTRGIYGYKNLDNKWVIQPAFDEAYAFSEGMAVVGKKDEFGVLHYGYVNETGKLVIPLQYSRKPGNFRGSRALIEPKAGNTAGISYAIIDKTGKTLFTATSAEIRQGKRAGIYMLNEDQPFLHGYTMDGNGTIMDSLGNAVSAASFAREWGLPERIRFSWKSPSLRTSSLYTSPYALPVMYFNGSNREFQVPTIGFIRMDTKKVIPAVFSDLGYFDPKSRLAYAKMQIGIDPKKLSSFREGYINEDGVFVIVKKQESEW